MLSEKYSLKKVIELYMSFNHKLLKTKSQIVKIILVISL